MMWAGKNWGAVRAHLKHRWQLPLMVVAPAYLVSYLVSGLAFGVWVEPHRALIDLALLVLLARLVLTFSRKVWAFAALMSLLIAAFFIGSSAKIAMLGRPVMPDDIYSVVALVRIMGWAGWIVVALPLMVMAGLFIGNLKFRGRAAKASFATLVALPIGIGAISEQALRGADILVGNHPWDQRENFTMRGPTFHILQETLRAFATRKPAPSETEVAAALDRIDSEAGDQPSTAYLDANVTPAGLGNSKPRNVHILLLESFWDPTPLLPKDHPTLDGKPLLDPRFTKLWDETGRSTAMSPTFSGGTANAEFEVLCGFPIDSWAVKFEQGFNTAPCLPSLLGEEGYRTVASHPNAPGFWNRINAYRRLGFETFWSQGDFKMDEMIVWMLSDRSLYRQVAEKIAAEKAADPRPVLDFIVTLYGHWTYDMVPERPAVVPVNPEQTELGQYATAMHYKSIELMDEIERLRREDPDSLIIAFGDHLPNLGYNWGEYKNNDFFKGGWGDFSPAMYARSRTTPLIVIDGENGPLKLGSQPLYRLNQLVLDRLGIDAPNIGALVPPPERITVRPVPDTIIGYDAANMPFLCNPGVVSGDCATAAAWLEDVKLVARDIFDGAGHALTLLERHRHPVAASLQ
ncbi:LTA synthase family protein [Dongia sp.]|uniref:LTA synthase family protein n=1 Tax=Dongia sp. TaxID=1977262 RepID=UPI0035B15F5F